MYKSHRPYHRAPTGTTTPFPSSRRSILISFIYPTSYHPISDHIPLPTHILSLPLPLPLRYGIAWTVTFLDNVGPVPALGVSCNDLMGSMVVVNSYRVLAAPAPSFTGGSLGIFQVTDHSV